MWAGGIRCSFNKMGAKGATALGTAMAALSQLTLLDLRLVLTTFNVTALKLDLLFGCSYSPNLHIAPYIHMHAQVQ